MKWLFGHRKPGSKVSSLLSFWHLLETVDLNRPELADKLRDFSVRLEKELESAKNGVTIRTQSGRVEDVDFVFDVLNRLPQPPERLTPLPEDEDFTWEKAETGLGPVARVVNRIRITFQSGIVSEYEKLLAEARRRNAPQAELEGLKSELETEIRQVDLEFRRHLKNLMLLYQLYEHCLHALARAGSPEVEQELIKRLRAAQPQERIFALKALRRRQFQPRTPEQTLDYWLAQAKLLDRDAERRQAERELERLIMQTDSFDSLACLLEPRLAEEGMINLQSRVLERMAEVAPEKALHRFEQLITNTEEPPELKIVAVQTTARLLLPVHLEPAVKLLVTALDDLETEVRVNAAMALGAVPENTPARIRTIALDRLLFALRDGDLEVRQAAARSITPRNYPDAGIRLAELLTSDNNPNAREYAAHALGLNFPPAPETTPALIQALSDPDAAVRKAAAEALVAQRNVPTDPRTRLQFFCARQDWGALSSAGKAALECLLPRLRDLRPEIRLEVARLLGRIKAPEAVHDLCVALSDSSQEVRKAAARALAEIGDPDAIPALRSAIGREGFREVREEMERAVKKLS
ncbi:MAG: HEAT repeat domain-containing protein [candidate division WOR-3 bacterium]